MLFSDGEVELKSYASNLYLYMSHYQIKDYVSIILCIQKVAETRNIYAAFWQLESTVVKC